jgi:hypothetical protein
MAWTSAFINAISASVITPIYVVESVTPPAGRSIGGTLFISSAPISFFDGKDTIRATVMLSPEGSSISSGVLQIREWSYTFGEWTIGLLSQNVGPYDIRRDTTRGQIVRLRIGFPGWSLGDFQTVALGVVQGVDASDGRWVLRVRSILSALTARWSLTVSQQALFFTSPREAGLDAAYTPGDPTIECAFSGIDAREDGGDFLLKIIPDTGDPFFLTATGTATVPDRFTGVSASAILGTTAVASTAAGSLEVVPYCQDHPFVVARKVLCSTGTALANGIYDTLPTDWSLGVLEELIDDADCRSAAAHFSPNTAPNGVWDVYETAPQEDVLAWLKAMLAPMGGFIAERQGMITIRGAACYFQPPGAFGPTWDIYDGDIVSIDTQHAWDPSTNVEYSRVRVTDSHAGDDDLDEALSTLPALGRQDLELPYVDSDRADWRAYVLEAIGPFSTRIAEAVTVTLRGWKFAQVDVGDHISIHTRAEFLSGRRRFLGGDLSDAAPLFVTSVRPAWFGATVTITAVLLPDVSDEGA